MKAESGSRLQSRGDQVEGLKGLKALGVRDLTYKLAFLACTVNTSFKKVIIRCFINLFQHF